MPNLKISETEIDKFFGDGGILQSKVENYEIRDAQLSMAKEVLSCFTLGGISLLEAGTGVGKSYAYLYPAILLTIESKANRMRNPVVIATSSITLQNQLFDKDLPQLLNYLGFEKDIKFSLLLGRNNYLCAKRFEDYRKDNSLFSDVKHIPEMALLDWARKTETGLKQEIQDSITKTEWNSVCSDSDLCLGFSRCPYALKCFYYKAHHEALSSDIIITNQHLLALDAKIRWEHEEDYDEEALLPPFQHLVIDEAHNFKEIARKIMSDEYASDLIPLLLAMLYKKDEKTGVSKLGLIFKALGINDKEKAKKLKSFDKNLPEHNKKVAKEIEKLITDECLEGGVNFNPLRRELYKGLFAEAQELDDLIFDFSKELDTLIRQYENLDTVNNDCLIVIKYAYQKLMCLSCALNALINLGNEDGNIIYVENVKGKHIVSVSPSDIGPSISDTLFSQIKSIVCTSATISTNKNFDYFINNLNIRSFGPTCQIYPSPFDYEHHMRILIPETALSYSINNEDAFKAEIKKTISDGIRASQGGALVLFTSYKMMNDVYSELVSEGFTSEFKIFCQGKDNSKKEMLKKFRRNINSSLFAVSSFWEGVDVPGDSLRLVIITKLPFISPTDPIYKGMELLQQLDPYQNQRSLFLSMSLPSTIISTKQGLGRLIRTNQDRGVVVFLDNRIISKPYGKQIQNSLPQPIVKSDDIYKDIKEFFDGESSR